MSAVSTGGSAAHSPGGPPPTSSNWSDLNLSKPRDINSVPFLNALGALTPKGMIEMRIYESGASTPYYSIKLTDFFVTSVSLGTSTINSGLSENISLLGNTLGFKDWVITLVFQLI